MKIQGIVNPSKSFLDTLNAAIGDVLDGFDPIKDMLNGFVKALKTNIAFGYSAKDILKAIDYFTDWADWVISKALDALGVPKDIPLPSLPSLDLPDLIDIPTIDLSDFLDKFDVSIPFPFLSCAKLGGTCGLSYEYGCYIYYKGIKVDTGRCYAYRHCNWWKGAGVIETKK